MFINNHQQLSIVDCSHSSHILLCNSITKSVNDPINYFHSWVEGESYKCLYMSNKKNGFWG